MFPRRFVQGVILLWVSALVGCGSGSGKPAPKNAAPPVNPVVQARQEMLHIAKKIEDAAAFESLESYVKNAEHEDPEQRWKWEDLDEYILRGSYSFQTRGAYEKWRNAKIAESTKRK